MTKDEIAILEDVARKILLLCSQSEVDAKRFEERASLLRERFHVVQTSAVADAGEQPRPGEVLQLNTETQAIPKFTNKEIKELPRLKEFTIRRRNKSFEFRYRKNGYNVSFCSTDFDTAKNKAKEWLALYNHEIASKEHFVIVRKEPNDNYYNNKQTRFGAFAIDYMEKVKKKKVKPRTYQTYYNHFKSTILPKYSRLYIREITPSMLQEHLTKLHNQKPRACEDVKTLLNNIFTYAIAHGIIERNPLDVVFIAKHERKTGSALTPEEEKAFLQNIKGHKLELAFIVALYTGVRRCEIKSITFDRLKNTVTIKNGKLKNYQTNYYRTIPIFPKLQPYLPRLLTEDWKKPFNEDNVKHFNDVCPNHQLKDLRHTFTTRAKECGISDEVVSIWTGHSLKSITARVYTHFSEEYMQEQGKKLDYIT